MAKYTNFELAKRDYKRLITLKFSQIQHLCGFQEANVATQRDNLIDIFISRCRRSKICTTSSHCTAVLQRLHKDLFLSARKFLSKVNGARNQLVYISDGDKEEEAEQWIDEMVTYLCIWGEAANLRNVAELMVAVYCAVRSTLEHFEASDAMHIRSGENVDRDKATNIFGQSLAGIAEKRKAFEASLISQESGAPSAKKGDSLKIAEPLPFDGYFLNEFIIPLFKLLTMDLVLDEDKARSAFNIIPRSDHVHLRNYDDLNETMWNPESWERGDSWGPSSYNYMPIHEKAKEILADCERYKKEYGRINATYLAASEQSVFRKHHIERRGLLPILRAFARLIYVLIMMGSFLLVIAMCNRESVNEDCTANDHLLLVIPTAIAVFLMDIVCSFFLGVSHERIGKFARKTSRFFFFILILARWVFKAGVCVGLVYMFYTGKGNDRYNGQGHGVIVATVYLMGYWFLEWLYFLDPFYKHLASHFAWVNILLGTSVFNSPHTIKRTERSQTFIYSFFWLSTLAVKGMVSYYASFKPMFEVGHVIKSYVGAEDDYLAIEPRTIDFSILGLGESMNFSNDQGILMLAPLWMMVMCFFFGDLEVWYLLTVAILSSLVGVSRHVNETNYSGLTPYTLEGLIKFIPALTRKVSSTRDEFDEEKTVSCFGRIKHEKWRTYSSEKEKMGTSRTQIGVLRAPRRPTTRVQLKKKKGAYRNRKNPMVEMTSTDGQEEGSKLAAIEENDGDGGESEGGVDDVDDGMDMSDVYGANVKVEGYGVMARGREASRTYFADMWNAIAESWREEDIISSEQLSTLLYCIDGVSEDGARDLTISPSFLHEGLLRDAEMSMSAMLKELGEMHGNDITDKADFKTIRQTMIHQYLGFCFADKAVVRAYDWAQLGRLVASFLKLLVGEQDASFAFETFRTLYATVTAARIDSNTSRFSDLHFRLVESFPNILFDPKTTFPGSDGDWYCSGAFRVNTKIKFDCSLLLLIKATAELCTSLVNAVIPFALASSIQNFLFSVDVILQRQEMRDGETYHTDFKWEDLWKNRIRKDRHVATRGPVGGAMAKMLNKIESARKNVWINIKGNEPLLVPLARIQRAHPHAVRLALNFCVNHSQTTHAHGADMSEEAKRRILFLVNSIKGMYDLTQDKEFHSFFHMPSTDEMSSFGTLTPYYAETVCESLSSLIFPSDTNDGLSTLTYLQDMAPTDWQNFRQRICRGYSKGFKKISPLHMTKDEFDDAIDELTALGTNSMRAGDKEMFLKKRLGISDQGWTPTTNEEEKRRWMMLGSNAFVDKLECLMRVCREKPLSAFSEGNDEMTNKEKKAHFPLEQKKYSLFVFELIHWASRRGQTLWRTVTGMMRNDEAIKLQYLREKGLLFKNPMHRRTALTICRILRDPTMVTLAELQVGQSMLAEKLEDDRTGIEMLVKWLLRDGGVTSSVEVSSLHKSCKDRRSEDTTWHAPEGPIKDLMVSCADVLAHFSHVVGYICGHLRSDQEFIQAVLLISLHWISDDQGHQHYTSTSHAVRRNTEPRTGGVIRVAECVAAERYYYVVTAQIMGNFKEQASDYFRDVEDDQVMDNDIPALTAESGKRSKMIQESHKYMCIRDLMRMYPSLRVAYVLKEWKDNKAKHSSILCRYSTPLPTWTNDQGHVFPCDFSQRATYIEVLRQVRLPGHFLVGEAKAMNQNHAIIFTRGEAIQAIDMNQDHTLEEAMKVPALMTLNRNGTILGFREHVYTADVSTMAKLMAYMELTFVTTVQRASHYLRVRQHYGHPDTFHKLSVIGFGGMSKGSKKVNLSEDIFAGFNFTLRGGESEHYDFTAQLKGKDVSFGQINTFITKISQGNAEQSISRDVMRLAHQYDLFRHMSYYYSSVGHFFNSSFGLFILMFSLYFRLFMALTEAESDLQDLGANKFVSRVQIALFGSQIMQFVLMSMVAGFFSVAVEKGLYESIQTHASIIFRGGLLFFSFLMGTKGTSFQTVIFYGKGGYAATGRGFGLKHTEFAELYRGYVGSHVLLGMELAFGLIVYRYTSGLQFDETRDMFIETFPLVLVSLSFIYTPFVLNPGALNSFLIREDWKEFMAWLYTSGGTPKQSWQKWYTDIIKDNAVLPAISYFSWKPWLCKPRASDESATEHSPSTTMHRHQSVTSPRRERGDYDFNSWLKDDSSYRHDRAGNESQSQGTGISVDHSTERLNCCQKEWLIPYALGPRVWYIFLPSCRKLILVACCAHVAYEYSAYTEVFMKSSIPPFLIAAALFLFLFFVDWFLHQSAVFKEKLALISIEDIKNSEEAARKERHRRAAGRGCIGACYGCCMHCFTTYICCGMVLSSVKGCLGRAWRSMRLHSRQTTWLIASIFVMAAIISLVARAASPTVILWVVMCLATTMYWVLHDVYLVLLQSDSKYIREIGTIPSHFVTNYLRAVHLVIGGIIMAPLFFLSMFPFFNQLHNELLFNDIFAARADNDYHLKRIVNKKGE